MYIFVSVSKGTNNQLQGIARKVGVTPASIAGRILRDYFSGRIAYVRVADRVNISQKPELSVPAPATKGASS